MSLISRLNLLKRLQRGRTARERFVSSTVSKDIAFQIRATRPLQDSVATLRTIAAALDVGLIVRLAPFSELVDWESSTPRTNYGITTEALRAPSFDSESEKPDVDFNEAVFFQGMANASGMGSFPEQHPPATLTDSGSQGHDPFSGTRYR